MSSLRIWLRDFTVFMTEKMIWKKKPQDAFWLRGTLIDVWARLEESTRRRAFITKLLAKIQFNRLTSRHDAILIELILYQIHIRNLLFHIFNEKSRSIASHSNGRRREIAAAAHRMVRRMRWKLENKILFAFASNEGLRIKGGSERFH